MPHTVSFTSLSESEGMDWFDSEERFAPQINGDVIGEKVELGWECTKNSGMESGQLYALSW